MEVKHEGIVNISQKNSVAISRQLDRSLSSSITLQTQAESSMASQGAKVGATLNVDSTSPDKSLLSCEVKMIKEPKSEAFTQPHATFQKTTEESTTDCELDFTKLATCLLHLSQFGTQLDVQRKNGSNTITFSVNGAEWTLPITKVAKEKGSEGISVKNLPLPRFLNVLRQAERICESVTKCTLSMPGVLLTCAGSSADVQALLKEERKKKG